MDLTRLTRVDTTTWRIEPHGADMTGNNSV